MMLHLVKKDFLLVKKYALVMLLINIVLPLFILSLSALPALTAFVPLLFTVFFIEFMLCQSVSLTEAKYPKADALLCATPYSRSSIVRAKYVFFLLVFIICIIVYSVLAMIVPQIGMPNMPNISMPNISEILLILLIAAIPYGIYMPFQFKFGYEKTKFAFAIILLGLSFGFPVLYNANIRINLSIWETLPVIVQCLILAVSAIVILWLSMQVSINIYKKKEL